MYEELVKTLRCCGSENQCKGCPRENAKTKCYDEICVEAADAIEQLSADLERSIDWAGFWQEEAGEALKKFQTTVAKIPRWIPVTERLPKVRTWVLCYCRANSFDVFRMTDEGDWQYGNRSIYMKGYVTHWMPLPEPPKDGES